MTVTRQLTCALLYVKILQLFSTGRSQEVIYKYKGHIISMATGHQWLTMPVKWSSTLKLEPVLSIDP